MTRRAIVGLVAILIMLIPTMVFVPSSPKYPSAHALAATTPTLEAVSPGYGSNITNLNLIAGSTFKVDVNVTNAGQIVAFDITLDFAISPRMPAVLSTNKAMVSLSGGLFDPSTPPTGCSVDILKEIVLPNPFYSVRVAATLLGGCLADGTGRLFSVTFTVTGVGASSLAFERTLGGRLNTLLVGPPPGFAAPPDLQVINAYFRNKAGVPPVALFTYTPSVPTIGKSVTFNATQSYDPDNAGASQKGISQYLWSFSDNSPQTGSQSVSKHIFLFGATVPASGYFEVRLVVNDTDNGIPVQRSQVVNIGQGVIHSVSPNIVPDNNQVNAGTPIKLTVTVTNSGNQDDNVTLTVTYDYQGGTAIANPPEFVLTQNSAPKTFTYTLETTSLPARVYQITALVQLRDATDSSPYNPYTTAITILPGTSTNQSFGLNVPALAVGVVLALAAIGSVSYALKRRRKGAEEAEDRIA